MNSFPKVMLSGLKKRLQATQDPLKELDAISKELDEGMALRREGKVKALTYAQIENGQFIADPMPPKKKWWKW